MITSPPLAIGAHGLTKRFGVGEQRVDVIAADGAAFERLKVLLGGRLAISPVAELRTVSVAAPLEVEDLARVAGVVSAARIPVDEIALRRPTLDDAFLVLTGHPATEEPALDVSQEEAA